MQINDRVKVKASVPIFRNQTGVIKELTSVGTMDVEVLLDADLDKVTTPFDEDELEVIE